MTHLRSFRELDAWKRSVELARKSYHVIRKLPAEEKFGIASQLRRAAVSVPANIAEGYARPYRKEYLQFLGIARASLAELQTLLILVVNLELLPGDCIKDAYLESEEVGKLLFRLRAALKS